MLYIVNTFDYEIFMGQNYVSEEEVLIKPTRKLCQMLCSEGVSSTFLQTFSVPFVIENWDKKDFLMHLMHNSENFMN